MHVQDVCITCISFLWIYKKNASYWTQRIFHNFAHMVHYLCRLLLLQFQEVIWISILQNMHHGDKHRTLIYLIDKWITDTAHIKESPVCCLIAVSLTALFCFLWCVCLYDELINHFFLFSCIYMYPYNLDTSQLQKLIKKLRKT